MDKNEAKKAFGKNLKRIRTENGMSQEELAIKLGYKGRSAVNKIETGVNDMPRSMVIKCAAILGVSPLAFFEDEDRPRETLPGGGFHGSSWTDGSEKINKLTTAIFNGDISKLNEPNQARLMSYYQALLDTQEETDEST